MIHFPQFINASKHKPMFMAIANVTPDSFSDGGDLISLKTLEKYFTEAWEMGAQIIDIGAESTKPNAQTIDIETEIMRLRVLNLPLRALEGRYFSIDTYKAKTAEFALKNGFHIINDITGLQHDPDIAKVAADYDAGLVIMHNQRLVDQPSGDILRDVMDGFKKSLDIAFKHHIHPQRICLDIGIGFGISPQDNIKLIHHISEFKALGYPIMVGASRKSFIQHFLGITDPKKRGPATLAAHHKAVINGANILRVHDLADHKQFFAMDALFNT